jgi:uncharacterized protein YjbI with pentapeptide repeats
MKALILNLLDNSGFIVAGLILFIFVLCIKFNFPYRPSEFYWAHKGYFIIALCWQALLTKYSEKYTAIEKKYNLITTSIIITYCLLVNSLVEYSARITHDLGVNYYLIQIEFVAEHYDLLLISALLILYCCYEIYINKDKKFFIAQLFTICFATLTLYYPFHNERISFISSSIRNLNNDRFAQSSNNIAEKEEIIYILNKYHFSNPPFPVIFNKSFNFSKINLKNRDSYLPFSRLYHSDFSGAKIRHLDFRWSSIHDSSFAGADLDCVDFSNSSLNNTTFKRIRISSYCNYNISSSLNFSNADIQGTNFLEVKLIGLENYYQKDYLISELMNKIKNGYNIDLKTYFNFTDVKNIEYACFDKGIKEEIVKMFNLEINEEETKKYELEVCNKIRKKNQANQ